VYYSSRIWQKASQVAGWTETIWKKI